MACTREKNALKSLPNIAKHSEITIPHNSKKNSHACALCLLERTLLRFAHERTRSRFAEGFAVGFAQAVKQLHCGLHHSDTASDIVVPRTIPMHARCAAHMHKKTCVWHPHAYRLHPCIISGLWHDAASVGCMCCHVQPQAWECQNDAV